MFPPSDLLIKLSSRERVNIKMVSNYCGISCVKNGDSIAEHQRSAQKYFVNITRPSAFQTSSVVSVAFCLMSRHVSSLKNFTLIIQKHKTEKKAFKRCSNFFRLSIFRNSSVTPVKERSFTASAFGFQLLFRLVIPYWDRKNNTTRYCHANISLNTNHCLQRL